MRACGFADMAAAAAGRGRGGGGGRRGLGPAWCARSGDTEVLARRPNPCAVRRACGPPEEPPVGEEPLCLGASLVRERSYTKREELSCRECS